MSVDIIYHASQGHLFNVRKLLEHGILPDATNSSGETALFHAALEGHLHVVLDLLKYGADPNRCSVNGLSPVNAACFKDNVKSLAALLYHGGRLEHPALSESAVVTAQKYRSRRVNKYITRIKEDALTNFTGEFEDVIDKAKDAASSENKEEEKSISDEFQPGSCSSIPFTDSDQLTTLHEGVRFSFIGPHVTFRNGCWNRIAVTVKTSESKEDMVKDLEMLSNLRHPRVAMILAGVSSPNTGLTSLLLDYFKLGSLHHVLYVSKLHLTLVQRITILFDISKAMKYIHEKRILHCYINPYSVLIDGDFRAKIGNFEHAQRIDNELSDGTSVNHIGEQHAWMAPGQLNGEPANKSSDVYSFGAMMWECLATKQPWSWLTSKTIFQALCEECLRLPILQDWPTSLKKILTECTGPEQERSDFDTISEHLDIIQKSDLKVPEEILENAFEMWLTGKHKFVKQRRKSSGLRPLASKISRNISALIMDSESEEEEEDDAKVRLLTTRRRSSSLGLSRRRNAIQLGMLNVMNVFHHANKNDLRKQKDTEKYGLEVAEELATVRTLWKTAKSHVKHRWAKEMFIRRKLEGDIKRIKMTKRFKGGSSDLKARQAQKGQRVRRLSHGEQSIARLRTIAYKYEKWDWARYTTGHQYPPPEDKYKLSEGDDDEDVEDVEEETVISRDVLKETDSSNLHFVPLVTDNIEEEDEQLEGSIDERFDDGYNIERTIAGNAEKVEALEQSHKHEKQVEGREQQEQEYNENEDVKPAVKKEGKEEEEGKLDDKEEDEAEAGEEDGEEVKGGEEQEREEEGKEEEGKEEEGKEEEGELDGKEEDEAEAGEEDGEEVKGGEEQEREEEGKEEEGELDGKEEDEAEAGEEDGEEIKGGEEQEREEEGKEEEGEIDGKEEDEDEDEAGEGEEEEVKDGEEQEREEVGKEDEEEHKKEGNGSDDLQDNKDNKNKSREDKFVDHVSADKGSGSKHQHSENESQSPDTNGNKTSNEDVNAKNNSSSDNLRTEGINRESSYTSEDRESSGKVSLSTDAVNILDEFSQWLDDYCEGISSDFEDDGEIEIESNLNYVLDANAESSRDVTPENDLQQSASKETLLDKKLESPCENGSNRSDEQPIPADMPLTSKEEDLERVQPSTSGMTFLETPN